jgi:mycothiol system anti-sigma-R factor
MSGPSQASPDEPSGWRFDEVEVASHTTVSADAAGSAGDDCVAMVAKLYEFLDGELTEQRRYLIQAHLEGCPSCFSAFDFELELRLVVADRVKADVPVSLVERVRRAISEDS